MGGRGGVEGKHPGPVTFYCCSTVLLRETQLREVHQRDQFDIGTTASREIFPRRSPEHHPLPQIMLSPNANAIMTAWGTLLLYLWIQEHFFLKKSTLPKMELNFHLSRDALGKYWVQKQIPSGWVLIRLHFRASHQVFSLCFKSEFVPSKLCSL